MTRTVKDTLQRESCHVKPANHTLISGDWTKNFIIEDKPGCLATEKLWLPSNENILSKTMSSSANSCFHGENLLKISTKINPQTLLTSECAIVAVSPANSENFQGNREVCWAQSYTMKNGEKVSTKSKKSKNRQSQEIKEATTENKYTIAGHQKIENPIPKRISKVKAEEICLKWIKSLNQLENKLIIESGKAPLDKEIPEFCSNRICPISK